MRPLSPFCTAFLNREEALRLAAYDDHDGRGIRWMQRNPEDAFAWRRPDGAAIIGFPTIGWGRRIWAGEEARLQTCTREQADAWREQRLEQVDLPEVDRHWPGANDFQRGAIASRSYNAGSASLVQDGITAAKLNAIGRDAFRDLYLRTRITTKGVVSAILQGRRAREWALFCHDYEPTPAELEDVLMSVRATGAQMVLELPSLQGVILSEDESPH